MGLDETLLQFIRAQPILAVVLTLAVVAIFGYLLLPAKWPFKQLQRRGTYQTHGLPTDGNVTLKERKRDFARFTTPSTQPGVFVVTASASTPQAWFRQTKDGDAGLDDEVAETVFSELDSWLRNAVPAPVEGLAERCVALLAVSNGIDFAMKHQIPLMMNQPKFVLMVSSKGEVRIAWFTFIVDEVKPNISAGPYMVKMITEDLNTTKVQAAASKQGVSCEYVAGATSKQDMGAYVKEQAAAFSRAVVENEYKDLLVA
eukprot:gnl/MRDRNA2_/MRDRNA2_58723_c0_seq1.p1 gnl/MRDRNA2_/MRDRNA2_58723_c0~~gnl/MRDRNA2_/MRDRNA2_58723_c0_seq1.p1  ORF type:complete len:258 (+),score=57.53 gnl/MRDRNA2_/MRDRNA2_58723_c0_seq1:73-846(+)